MTKDFAPATCSDALIQTCSQHNEALSKSSPHTLHRITRYQSDIIICVPYPLLIGPLWSCAQPYCPVVMCTSILFLLDPLFWELYVSTEILLTVSDLSYSCFEWCLLLVAVSPLATPAEWPAALSLWLGGQTNVTPRESITIIINVSGFCFAPNC